MTILITIIITFILTTLFYIWSFKYGYLLEKKQLLEEVETYRKQKQDLKDFIKIQLKITDRLNQQITDEQINKLKQILGL